MTYRETLSSVDEVRSYMTDPIGKCLRTTCGKKKTRIDLLYLDSNTYRSFLAKENLGDRFDLSRAEKALLRWVETPRKGATKDLIVQIDRTSGIVQQRYADGSTRYGHLADVQDCVIFLP